MIDFFFAPFGEFAFMRRALVGCLALALGATPIGVFLVLRRMSLAGDAMSHAILPGAAVGFIFAGMSLPAMTVGGAVAGILIALAAGLVSRSTVLHEDASLATFFLISLALGVLLMSARGEDFEHTLLHVLFGDVRKLGSDQLVLIAGIASLSLVALAILYRPLVLECLEPAFLRSVSRLSAVTHHAFLVLVVLNLVGGFHALGTLMSIGMMILPVAAARLWARDISTLLAIALGVALVGSYAGLLLSFHADLPPSSCIILSIGAIYIASLLVGRGGVITTWYRSTRHLEA